MKECHICKKRMPQHVFGGHMRKRHPEAPYKEAPKIVKKTRGPLESKSEDARYKKQQEVNGILSDAIADLVVRVEKLSRNRFDFQKPETCASCQQVHPSLLMRYHAHTSHGV